MHKNTAGEGEAPAEPLVRADEKWLGRSLALPERTQADLMSSPQKRGPRATFSIGLLDLRECHDVTVPPRVRVQGLQVGADRCLREFERDKGLAANTREGGCSF